MNHAQAAPRGKAVSLRTRLVFWNVVALALMLVLLGVVCRFITLRVLMGSVNDEMARAVRMYIRPPHFGPPPGMRQGPDGGGPRQGPPRPGDGPPQQGPQDQLGRPPNPAGPPGNSPDRNGPGRPPPHPPDAFNPYRPHLYTAKGVSAMRDDARPVWDSAGLEKALHGETFYSDMTIDDEPVRILSLPGFLPQGQKGAIQYGYPLKEVYRAVSGINLALLLLAPFGLAGAALAGIALTNRVLRPVEVMTAAAGEIGAADFSRRLPVTGDDEFARLAETFNGMLGGLDTAYRQQQDLMRLQQRFTADASHELKTPLTIIKGRAGMGLDRQTTDEKSRRAFEEIEAAATTMDRLVQDLLLLARSDEGLPGGRETELLAMDVLGTARRQLAASNRVETDILPQDLTLKGNEADLVRLFRNLMENACAYSAADAPVSVSVRRDVRSIIITVLDKGCGIAPEHLPHLGERFYRVDESRTSATGGTGLGLSICRSIVSAHGGAIDFQSAVGVGTKVTVKLPG